MPPQLPSPIVAPQGRRDPIQQLLLSLVGSAAQTGLSAGLQQLLPQPEQPLSPSQQQVRGEQRAAQQQLRASGDSAESAVLRQSPANPFSQQFDPEADPGEASQQLEDLQTTAPERLERRRQAEAREQAVAAARDALSRDPQNSEQLVRAFDFASAANTIMDSGTVNALLKSTLPLSEADKVGLALDRVQLQGVESQQEADAFATERLIQEGILPAGSPPIPGAGDTLLSVAESRVEEAEPINWPQEGIDFITNRVGESVGGTGGFTIGPGGQATIGGGGAGPVSVEQAVGEWREIVERFAPPERKERILSQIDTNAFQNNLTRTLARRQVQQILQANPDITDEEIREDLSNAFSDKEISNIIRNARRRNAGAIR